MTLNGQRIAFIATDGVEEIELTHPWEAVTAAGGDPVLVSPKEERVLAMHGFDRGGAFDVDVLARTASADDFDGLVLPGGVANPDALRLDDHTVALIRAFVDSAKPVAAICHAPWALIEAHAVVGRRVTSYPSLRTDLANAGAEWLDREVVVCDAQPSVLVTSRRPDDLGAFSTTTIERFAAHRRNGAVSH